ncbi:MAG: NADP-dependent oxidoreductase, partial [Bacteroidales bacterium]|nr:NADP-dependent oxidoreductase [Bacteroidales bacterium]
MKAAIINQFGDPEVLEFTEIEKPQIKDDQILIRVFATGINPIDWKQRKGNHKFILGSPFPIVLGYDVCGEVVEIGSEISKFKVGDQLFGVLDNKYGGALAEFALGHENCFSLKPSNISNEEAAAYPMVSLTALQALRDKANFKVGQTILINGASGGVGHMAMQIAKLMGAKVIAVSSTNSRDFVNDFEPDQFIDYTKENVLDINEKVDVFFDIAGNYSFLKTKKILKSGGVYLNLEYIKSLKKMPVNLIFQLFSKGKRAKSLLMKHNSSDIELVAKWISDGSLKVSIDEVFNLKNVVAAHDYAQKGHNKGKNV